MGSLEISGRVTEWGGGGWKLFQKLIPHGGGGGKKLFSSVSKTEIIRYSRVLLKIMIFKFFH